MATPVVSGAIVKLSNEKIRKYHLARAPRDPPAAAHTTRLHAIRSLSLLSYFRTALFPSSLSFSFCRFHDDGRNNRGAFGRLPAVTGDGTAGSLVKWLEVSKGRDRGWEGGKNGQSFVRPIPARATESRENFRINEGILFEIILRHQRRKSAPPLTLSGKPASRSPERYLPFFIRPLGDAHVVLRDAFRAELRGRPSIIRRDRGIFAINM